MKKKIFKCVDCGHKGNNPGKDSPISGGFSLKYINQILPDSDYEFHICDACSIGNGLICLSTALKNEVISDKILRDCLAQAGIDILKKQKEQRE